MQTDILFESRNHVGLITLNRPAALNSLSLPMLNEMGAQLREWARDDSIYAVLVKGSGEKAFCAGGDIRALYESLIAGGTLHETFFPHEYRLDYSIYRYPKPYLALMNGITMGGGMGISQGARLRIAGDRTRMAMPETGIGLFPDVGASHFLSRLPRALGTYLGLTGAQIGAADALALKLADVYLSPEAITGLEDALSTTRWGRDICADIESLMRKSGVRHLPGATLPALQPVIDKHFPKPGFYGPGSSIASVRDIMESLETETRPEYRDWAQSTLATLRKRSPLMLAVTVEQLQRGARMTLADCFRMELTMVHRCSKENDLIEGIRALLIDKDNTPRWQPARLEDVSEERVAQFFSSPWSEADHPLAGLEQETQV